MTSTVDHLNGALEGRYRVARLLGEGGMATVYLADDLRHERQVALKVLKTDLAAVIGADRFLAEIKTTANLQHSHVLPLFDSGDADGLLFYVMPYVKGESLKDRITRERQLPVDEAVRIVSDMAGALDYAHRQAVIHRDIKPANVLLHDGQPLIADFGIALAVSTGGVGRLTETGLSLGTPHYMSPEQAAGDSQVGSSTDIYALGCVLFELLVGEPPFTGSTPQAILGKIVMGETPIASVERKSVPPNVDAVIVKAMEKLPADRFVAAGDVARALADPRFRVERSGAPLERAGGRRALAVMSIIASVSVILAVLAWAGANGTREVMSLDIPMPASDLFRPTEVTRWIEVAPNRTLLQVRVIPSPDGGPLSVMSIAAKRPAQRDFELIPGADSAWYPRASPDGGRIAYLTHERGIDIGYPHSIRVVPIEGGSPVTVAEGVGTFEWFGNDEIVFTAWSDDALSITPSNGPGSREVYRVRNDSVQLRYGLSAVDERAVLFTRCGAPCALDDYEVWALDPNSGEAHHVLNAVQGEYVRSGHLVFVTAGGELMAVRFDKSRLEIDGQPVPIMDGVAVGAFMSGFSVSEEGTLLVALGQPRLPSLDAAAGTLALGWISRAGRWAPVDSRRRFEEGEALGGVSLSPNGDRIALGLASEEGEDIWIKELPDGPFYRLTDHPAADGRPQFSPDGDYVVFASFREDSATSRLFRRRADGTGAVEPFLSQVRAAMEVNFSPDGTWAVVSEGASWRGSDLIGYRLPGGDRVPLLTGSAAESYPRISPDGKWLAYSANESGEFRVYVRPFPDVGAGRVPVSASGGLAPMWSPTSNELFYFTFSEGGAGYELMSATFEAERDFRVTGRRNARPLPGGLQAIWPTRGQFAISADGERILGLYYPDDPGVVERDETARVLLILNWVEELVRLVGT